jgi:hypothetical protein
MHGDGDVFYFETTGWGAWRLISTGVHERLESLPRRFRAKSRLQASKRYHLIIIIIIIIIVAHPRTHNRHGWGCIRRRTRAANQ